MDVPSTGYYVDVDALAPKHCRIWTRKFPARAAQPNKNALPLVLIHGMASGLALWGMNLPGLTEERTVYAIDLPGFGRSSRDYLSSKPTEAEDQYVTAIDQWREKQGLEKMCLTGHSFGGYLATAYALKYPERVAHLILADPWGMKVRPSHEELAKKYDLPWYLKAAVSVVKNFNPLATLRASGPFGPGLVKRARPDLMRKFLPLFPNETVNIEVISNYIFHANVQTPA